MGAHKAPEMVGESARMIDGPATKCRCRRILLRPMLRSPLNMFALPLVLCAAATVHAQRNAPMQQNHSTRDIDTSMNYPVEPRVADRGGLCTSTRQMPMELAEPQGFDRLYEVPGKSGVFYRANGGLFLVFERGTYAQVQDKQKRTWSIPTVPPGGQYYIGKPDWSSIRRIGSLAAGSLGVQQDARLELSRAAGEPTPVEVREVDLRIDARVDTEMVPEIADSTQSQGGNRAMIGRASASRAKDKVAAPELSSDSEASEGTAEGEVPAQAAVFASKAPDAAAWARTLPGGVDRSFLIERGDDVQPRMVADFIYRQRRLDGMFGRAMESEGS